LQKIETLQTHFNNEVYQKAVNILEKYFGAEEVGDETITAVNQNQQTFTFAAANQNQGFQFN